jgi:carbon storage regulator
MLVLTRRTGESVKIGDDITLTILGVNGNQIRVGVDAPREIQILRGELTPRSRAHVQNVSHHERNDGQTSTA